jgi:hypothetical protein
MPLIVVGNLSGISNNLGKADTYDVKDMNKENTLRPLAQPVTSLLASKGVTSSVQLGYSFGADKAAVTSSTAPQANQTVTRGVFIEPSSIEKQPITRLLKRFMASSSELWSYVDQSESASYSDVRAVEKKITNAPSTIAWFAGLARPTNRAIAQVLANGQFDIRIGDAINANPGGKFVMNRFGSMVLRNMHHAGGDDVDLHAAIMMQGMRL